MDSAPSAVTSHLAALLPSVAAEAAAGARLMHDRQMAPLWAALDAAPGLALTPVPGPGAGRLYDLLGESDVGRWALAISATDDATLAMAAATGLGGRLRSLVVNALLGEALERLATLALPGARVVALAPSTVAPHAAESWCALRRDGLELCRIAVRTLSPAVAEALRAARQPAGAGSSWRGAMRLAGAVAVAERKLSIALLQSLEPGDVVLLPGTSTTLDGMSGVLCIRAGSGASLGAPGRLEGNAITLLEGLRTMEQDTLPATSASADSLGELELPLRFEIETVSIALSDLEAIEPGYVIEFDTPVSQARLRLVSCGMVIGEADLITVGNRLGARITHLVPRHESDQQRG